MLPCVPLLSVGEICSTSAHGTRTVGRQAQSGLVSEPQTEETWSEKLTTHEVVQLDVGEGFDFCLGLKLGSVTDEHRLRRKKEGGDF